MLWVSIGAILALGIIGYLAVPYPDREIDEPLWAVEGGDPSQAPEAIIRYGCFSCHVIPGIRKATGRVGPKLLEIQDQIYIGGVLANSPVNMIDWIQNPRRFSPETAMPDLEVTDRDSRDMTAYLYHQS